MVDVAAFDAALVGAVHRRRSVVTDGDNFEVRAHPFDYEDLALAPDQQWAFVRTGDWLVAGDGRWRGVPVRPDPEIQQGRPELCSTWREVLHG